MKIGNPNQVEFPNISTTNIKSRPKHIRNYSSN